MRAFVGLPLPQETVDWIEDQQASLRTGRMVAAENLHLTLAFLDEQNDQTLEALHHALREITANPMALRITGLDVMGGANPRVLAAMIAANPDLAALRDAVRGAARQAEIDLPRERFRPHITVARFPRRMEPHDHKKLALYLSKFGAQTTDIANICRFTLFQSDLTPERPIYTGLADYPLVG